MTAEPLDQIGLRLGAPQASDGLDYLGAYEETLASFDPTPMLIVLALRVGALATAATFAARFPGAVVHLLLHGKQASVAPRLPDRVVVHRCRSREDRIQVMRALPRVDLLVEGFARNARAHLFALRDLHGYVRAGGVYAVEGVDRRPGDRSPSDLGVSTRAVIDLAAQKGSRVPKRGWTTWIDSVAMSLDSVTYHGDLALLTKRASLAAMLRSGEATGVLEARYAAQSPLETVLVRPGGTFRSRATITGHGRGPQPMAGVLSVPELAIRRYHDVVAYPRQLLRYDDFWLPESFRRQDRDRPNHHALVRSGDILALARPRGAPRRGRALDRPVYYLDTEFPGHFGHVTTEVVSRLWGWDRALQDEPDLHALISLRRDQSAPPAFLLTILEAYGIPRDRLVVQRGDEHLELPVLYGADQEMENRSYVVPELADTWTRIRAGLGDVTSPLRADKIFVTRAARRKPRQAEAVEQFFTDEGFVVVRPETYAFAEQVALFEQARIIAGYGGSGMFTMAYAPHARVILISSTDYLAENEALFAAVNGNDLHYFWGKGLSLDPDPTKAKRAYDDDFNFRLWRHRHALRRLVR